MVLLVGGYAIKMPTVVYGWRLFLCGLLANLQERSFSRLKDPRMCPVIFSLPGGFLNVMPRCIELTDDEFCSLVNIKDFWGYGLIDWPGNDYRYKAVIPVENKSNSFGWHNGKVVAIDYGN